MNPEIRRLAESLLRAGHSDLEIHRRTGIARTTAARYRKQLGLPGYHTKADSPTCRHGHPFPDNLGFNEKGHLICLYCRESRGVSAPGPVEPDPVAIERAVAGDPPARLIPRERHAAIRQLASRGLSAAAIAERVRCSSRTVYRARSAA